MSINLLQHLPTARTDADKAELEERLEEVFGYHAWSTAQTKAGTAVRDALKEAARVIIQNVPASADRTVALRDLIDARMHANSAITFNLTR